MNLMTYGGRYLIDDLCRRKKISVSKIRDFNDPFEFHTEWPVLDGESLIQQFRGSSVIAAQAEKFGIPADIFWEAINSSEQKRIMLGEALDSTVRHARHIEFLNNFDELHRVLCCVLPPTSEDGEVFMWSYYGDRHRGVRIHLKPNFFDSEYMDCFNVNYIETPPIIPSEDRGNEFADFMTDLLTSKSDRWKHESEVRLFVDTKIVTTEPDSKGTIRDWIAVEPHHIARIDLGIRFENYQDVLPVILQSYPDAEVHVAAKDHSAYRCRYIRYA